MPGPGAYGNKDMADKKKKLVMKLAAGKFGKRRPHLPAKMIQR
jgi:hypothetical protein